MSAVRGTTPGAAGPRSWSLALLAASLVVLGLAGWRLAAAGPDPLSRTGGSAAIGTQEQQRAFGATPIVVALRAPVATTLDPANLSSEQALEASLSRLSGVKSVIGPAGLISGLATEVNRIILADVQAERSTSSISAAEAVQNLLTRYGYSGTPSLSNDTFIGQLLFGSSTKPKAEFAWLFPNPTETLLQVRPRAGLSGAATAALARRVRATVANANLVGVSATVAGATLLAGSGSSVSPGWHGWLLLAMLPLILGLGGGWWLTGGTAPGRGRGSLRVGAYATAGGSLLLVLTGVPLAEQLGLELAVGVGVVALTVAFLGSRREEPRAGTFPAGGTASDTPATGSASSAGRSRTAAGSGARLLGAVAAVVVLAGLVLGFSSHVGSGQTALTPSGNAAARALTAQQTELHTGGTLYVELSGTFLIRPAVISWMSAAGSRVQKLDPKVRPGPNLDTLLYDGDGGSIVTKPQEESVLNLLPGTLLNAVIGPGETRAEMSFVLPPAGAAAQAQLVHRILGALGSPPAGVTLRLAGSVGLAASAGHAVGADRWWLFLALLVVVLLVLGVGGSGPGRALRILAPGLVAAAIIGLIVTATGFALSLPSAALEVPLVALTAALGLWLDDAYAHARAEGLAPAAATGWARRQAAPALVTVCTVTVVTSALLPIAQVSALSQFALFTAVGVIVSALSVLALSPALAALADGPGRSAGPARADDSGRRAAGAGGRDTVVGRRTPVSPAEPNAQWSALTSTTSRHSVEAR